MECVVLAQDEALGQSTLLAVEDLGEAWRCRVFRDAESAYQALKNGADVLLLASDGESARLLSALERRPPAAPPWIPEGISLPDVSRLPLWLEERRGGIPPLAQRLLPEAERLARGLLRALAVPQGLGAWRFLPQMLALCTVHPGLMQDLKGRLYPLCASRCGMTPGAVERSLRLCVESAWTRSDLRALERFFGHSVDPERGKPTNREFLFRLQEHLMLAEKRIRG